MSATSTTAYEDVLNARLKSFGSDPRRERAFEAFAECGIPHRRIENWRWSDVRAAIKSIHSNPGGTVPEGVFTSIDADAFRFTDHGLILPEKRPAGVLVDEVNDVHAFGGAEQLPMGALAAALSDQPATLIIEIAAPLIKPLHFIFEGQTDRFQRISFILREGAEASILETHISGGGFSSSLLEYSLEQGAKLHRFTFEKAKGQAVQIVNADMFLKDQAELNQTSLSLGGKIARHETRIRHDGTNSKIMMNAAYLITDGIHADFTSHVTHTGENCMTAQTIRGAVENGGQGAFQGKFLVKRGAQKTDADMQHKALLLDDGAIVNAKPELEIYADDVQCAHGSTCGALDADTLFYMRQRGIPEKQARAILTESFIAEVFEAVERDDIRACFNDAVNNWLHGERS